MASYNPPTENLAIFDPSVFLQQDIALTTAIGDTRYLRYPNAQGTENMADTNINGILTTNSTVNFNETTLGSLTSLAIQPASNDSSTKVPTTAWVQTAIAGAPSSTLNAVLSNGNTATGTYANINLIDTDVGGQLNPIINLQNTNATGSVALEVYKNKPTAGLAGDVLFNQSVYGKDSALNKQEYTRISHTLRDGASGAEDGSIEMGCFVNGSFNNFLQINGNENEVNCLKTLDMGGNNIRTNTGDMSIQTTSSSGNGDLTITAKRDLQLLSAGSEIIISTASSTGSGDIDITGKSGSITTLTATLINLNSAGAINLTPTTSVVLSTQIQMPTTSGTISYNTTTGSLTINFASQSTGYFELSNLPAASIGSLILTNGRIGGEYHILLRGQLGFNWSPSTSSTFKANTYSLTANNGNEWVGLKIYSANTLSQFLVNATLYT
jgi:hypothetical protein